MNIDVIKAKYFKYKSKYLKLSGGGKDDTYTINFLWLNQNVKESHETQNYIFKFSNERLSLNYTDGSKIISIINLRKILNMVNIINWSILNSNSHINIWHGR